MKIDRFAQRIKTASLKEQRLKRIRLIILVLIPFSLFLSSIKAQSNVTYEVKVGTTAQNSVLEQFPDHFVGEKINIKIQTDQIPGDNVPGTIGDYDFVFADEPLSLAEQFDSVYSYADEGGTGWTVWRNRKEPKNRQQQVMVKNGRNAFESYLHETMDVRRSHGWIWWLFAGLALALTLAMACTQVIRRRKEKTLSGVEQEMLRRKRLGQRRHYVSQAYLWLLLLVLYAPIALIAVFSFTESKILGNWTGFSFGLYANLFTGQADAGLNSAIWYTVVIALIAAVCSTILGTLAAIGIYNMRARSRKAVSFLNSVPMINPDIITGISLFLLFVALGMSQGLATVCIAHVVFCTPYVVLSVLPRLSRMNPNTYEAALDLGATPAQALRMVMLPELWPGMLSGFILALTLSVDDFGVTFFTKGSGGLETLSTFIYSDARKGGLTPELRPLFTIILIVMLGVLVYINFKDRKKED